MFVNWNLDAFSHLQGDGEAVGNSLVEVRCCILFAGDVQQDAVTILKCSDLFGAFKHLMLHGSAQYLVMICILASEFEGQFAPAAYRG